MSAATDRGQARSRASKKVRTVRSIEAPRWTSLQGKMTPERRKAALREVAARMR